MEISLNCSDPAVAIIGDCAIEIPTERLVEFAAHAKVVHSPARGTRLIVDYTGDMFEFQYRHQVTDVWEGVPKSLWDERVLSHRKRIILKDPAVSRAEENLPHDAPGSGQGSTTASDELNDFTSTSSS